MTMHIIRGMTTTSTKKRKARKKSKALLKAEAEHEKFLSKLYKSRGVAQSGSASALGAEGRRFKSYRLDQPNNLAPTSDVIPGFCPKRKENTYTGDKLLGIATMHKSNMVPVFSKEQAQDVSTMRRN